MSLKDILSKIRDDSLRKDEVRQEVQTAVRRTTRLSKQAIFLIHKGVIDGAESLLEEARLNLDKIKSISETYPELFFAGLVDSAFEEYSEAHILLKLVKDGVFVKPEEIEVSGESYVLGLADVIGELRRRSLDLIRRGDVEGAEECLTLMENIYNEIIGCDELLILVSGLRRKCDIARRVIEATRGDITAEVRRTVLNNTMREFQKILETVMDRERQ
ncbi:MAG: translin family protein [Candidatus Bathyarchaeia archaeon]